LTAPHTPNTFLARDADFEALYSQGDALIQRLRATSRPRVFIISGPSGVGKDSVIEQLRSHYPNARYVVTATTRPMRRGEVDGIHYLFLGKQEFLDGLATNNFIEHALVYDNHSACYHQGRRQGRGHPSALHQRCHIDLPRT